MKLKYQVDGGLFKDIEQSFKLILVGEEDEMEHLPPEASRDRQVHLTITQEGSILDEIVDGKVVRTSCQDLPEDMWPFHGEAESGS